MGKKFLPVAKYPLDMADDDLITSLGGLMNSQLMRTLIMAEVEAIRNGAERETRTMRNMWYNYIKPVLSRMGVLEKKTRTGKEIAWDKLLSKYLAELVRGGLTSYSELYIIDGSRQRRVASKVTDDPAEPIELVGAHYPWLILFTEKDTMWEEVRAVASLYGVSAISGGGEPSNACTHNTIEAILKETDHDFVLLSLTDYDPHGYIIAGAQATQIEEAVDGHKVVHERLGLLPEQLTPEERRNNAYVPAKQHLAEWFEETDGVDGRPLGLELDALPLSRLRRMYAEGIERHVDLSKRIDDLHCALVDILACEILIPDFEEKRAKLIAAVRVSELWETITNTPIPDDLFRLAARAGWSYINPSTTEVRKKLLFDCQVDVIELMEIQP